MQLRQTARLSVVHAAPSIVNDSYETMMLTNHWKVFKTQSVTDSRCWSRCLYAKRQ